MMLPNFDGIVQRGLDRNTKATSAFRNAVKWANDKRELLRPALPPNNELLRAASENDTKKEELLRAYEETLP